jgi:mRNA interferase MazF
MGRFIKGDIVVIPFPFSDLSNAKRRPALVLADLKNDDFILCQITSRSVSDPIAVPVMLSDIEDGSLSTASNVRPNKLFTADKGIVLYRVGRLKESKLKTVIGRIIDILEE